MNVVQLNAKNARHIATSLSLSILELRATNMYEKCKRPIAFSFGLSDFATVNIPDTFQIHQQILYYGELYDLDNSDDF